MQNDARKRIDEWGLFHDVVADVKHGGLFHNVVADVKHGCPADALLLELVLLADPAAINAEER